MEIWYENLLNCRNALNGMVGYLPEFRPALPPSRQQRKYYTRVNKLISECETLRQRLDKQNQKLLAGL